VNKTEQISLKFDYHHINYELEISQLSQWKRSWTD